MGASINIWIRFQDLESLESAIKQYHTGLYNETRISFLKEHSPGFVSVNLKVDEFVALTDHEILMEKK